MRFLKREEISDGTDQSGALFLGLSNYPFKPFLIREEICNTKVGKTSFDPNGWK
jgi:hypothetical protein